MSERLIHIDTDNAVARYTTLTKSKALSVIADAVKEEHDSFDSYRLDNGNMVVYYPRTKTYLLLEVKKNA